MMKCIFAYHDALNGFVNIFLDNSDASAKRGFLSALACADVGSLFYSNPTDYSLYRLGMFDMSTGEIVVETPVIICKGEKRDV